MKSAWKVTSNLIGDTIKYAVYRIIDSSEPDHSGNREFDTDYIPDRDLCVFIANELNEKQ
jgi:hypothetical protein